MHLIEFGSATEHMGIRGGGSWPQQARWTQGQQYGDLVLSRFRALPLPEIARALSERIVVDGRNLFAPKEAAAAGLTYSAVGRGDN